MAILHMPILQTIFVDMDYISLVQNFIILYIVRKTDFQDTEIFLAEYPDHKKNINYWYKAENLSDDKRKEFSSYYGVGSLVLTKKKMNKDIFDVIQSDYEAI